MPSLPCEFDQSPDGVDSERRGLTNKLGVAPTGHPESPSRWLTLKISGGRRISNGEATMARPLHLAVSSISVIRANMRKPNVIRAKPSLGCSLNKKPDDRFGGNIAGVLIQLKRKSHVTSSL